jgi:hypothetical protein
LEYVSAVGSNVPAFEFVNGIHTIFPDGKRTPPANPPPPERPTAIFERAYGGLPSGFTTTTFAAVNGIHTTFPFGASTPPKNPVVAIVEFEYVRADGLYCTIFDVPHGIHMMFPVGKRTAPLNPSVVPVDTIFENVPDDGVYAQIFE